MMQARLSTIDGVSQLYLCTLDEAVALCLAALPSLHAAPIEISLVAANVGSVTYMGDF